MNPTKCTAAGELELLESTDCKNGGLFVRAHEHNRVVGELRSELEKLRESERRDNILTDAMCEIYATVQGRSDQPVEKIVNGCRDELCNDLLITPRKKIDWANEFERAHRIFVSDWITDAHRLDWLAANEPNLACKLSGRALNPPKLREAIDEASRKPWELKK